MHSCCPKARTLMQQPGTADRNSPDGHFNTDFAAIPEDIVSQRRGEVLLKHTILKSDHFPGEACNTFAIVAYSAAWAGSALPATAAPFPVSQHSHGSPDCTDECAGCQNKTLTDQLPGAPNFRQVLLLGACLACNLDNTFAICAGHRSRRKQDVISGAGAAGVWLRHPHGRGPPAGA
jgi:hypothetical protein